MSNKRSGGYTEADLDRAIDAGARQLRRWYHGDEDCSAKDRMLASLACRAAFASLGLTMDTGMTSSGDAR